jgi:1-deoxy-D-xylulose-5-phosphate synthase
MRGIPNMVVSSPMDEEELRNLMYTAQLPDQGPFSIRYPRGNGSLIDWQRPLQEITVGTGRQLKDGDDLAIITIGPIGIKAGQVIEKMEKEGVSIAHYDIRFVKPMDEALLHKVFQKHQKVICIEDGTIIGGMGSAVVEFMADNDYCAKVKRLGIPDEYIEHGTQTELYGVCGFDKVGMEKTIKEMLDK